MSSCAAKKIQSKEIPIFSTTGLFSRKSEVCNKMSKKEPNDTTSNHKLTDLLYISPTCAFM